MRAKRIFLSGASGSMGQAITRALVATGHGVLGAVRNIDGERAVAGLGAEPVMVNLFDTAALTRAVSGCDVVAHFATAIPTGVHAVRVSTWAQNDRLRREATAALLSAATAAAVPRCLFESISLAYPDRGYEWIDERVELDPVSPVMRSALDAERHMDRFAARGGEAVVLRFGRLYGPGRASAAAVTALRLRQLPRIGRGDNFVSSVHVDDVGTAVAASLSAPPGTYNVVDETPLSQRRLLEIMSGSQGAPRPRALPAPVARLLLGHAARVLTVSHRVSNRRFVQATGWRPRFASAVEGWNAMGPPWASAA